MPEVLLKQNLPEAVRSYCNNIQDSNFLQIDYQYYGSFDGLTEHIKLNVYRMIQELLKNIIQHAHATHALVQLQANENMSEGIPMGLAITVEDNGVGFNVNEPKKGIGLHNLQTRVSSLDGYLTIRSIPKKGTSVFIELPTPEPSR
jgi:two-component system, NarL family, sensor kinase